MGIWIVIFVIFAGFFILISPIIFLLSSKRISARKKLIWVVIALVCITVYFFTKEALKAVLYPENDVSLSVLEENIPIKAGFSGFRVGKSLFYIPNSYQPRSAGGDGFDITFYNPHLLPEAESDLEKQKSNINKFGNSVSIIVQVRDSDLTGDGIEYYRKRGLFSPKDYISKQDKGLGLILLARKNLEYKTLLFNNGYSLNNEVTTPYFHDALLVTGSHISFAYTNNIRVRIIMIGWDRQIYPKWKEVYLGVLKVLDDGSKANVK